MVHTISEAIRPIGMLRCGFLVSSAAVETASKPTYAKKIEAAAPRIPVPDELKGLPQPRGANGSKFAACPLIIGRVMMRNMVRAVTLITTSTALNVALSLV